MDHLYRVAVILNNLAQFDRAKQKLRDKGVVRFLQIQANECKDPDVLKEVQEALAELGEYVKIAHLEKKPAIQEAERGSTSSIISVHSDEEEEEEKEKEGDKAAAANTERDELRYKLLSIFYLRYTMQCLLHWIGRALCSLLKRAFSLHLGSSSKLLSRRLRTLPQRSSSWRKHPTSYIRFLPLSKHFCPQKRMLLLMSVTIKPTNEQL